MEDRNLTLNGLTVKHSIHLCLSVAMLGVSIYLTHHFYATLYPTQLFESNGFCNINSFLNCNSATYSPWAVWMGVPTSFFGLFVSLVFLSGSMFPSKEVEAVQVHLSRLNLAGCVVFFIYSLAVLGSLCPFCTVYYLLSAGSFYLLNFHGTKELKPSVKFLAFWAVIGLAGAGVFGFYTKDKAQKQAAVGEQVLGQFNQLAQYGDPDMESPFRLTDVKASFAQSPLRVSIFSDFQCPYCQKVANQFHEIQNIYKDKIAVQYFFFPLDSSCNPSMESSLHPFACDAARLAACSTETFVSIHDEIFANQEKINTDFLSSLAKKYKLEDCYQNKKSLELVTQSMQQAPKFNLKSTPTIIINGKKIEGSVPTPQLKAILDHLLGK